MSKFDHSKHDAEGDAPNSQSDDPIARLMNLAGPRDAVPADVEQRVHDQVRKVWRSSVVQRRTVRWSVPIAVAASVIIAVGLNHRTPDVAPPAALKPIATIARINGSPDLAASRMAVGDPVYAGDTISTGSSQGISLTMTRDMSLRLAAGTTVTIDSIDKVALATGRIYADSGQAIYRDRHITIVTDAGSATDLGTQFAVGYLQGEMSVAVREGTVDVFDQSESYTAESGDMLKLRPDSDVVFERISKYDDSWDWAVALAPAFDINNRSLLDFLNWAARETGKELEFANHDVRTAVMGTVLRGSVSGFTPSEALKSVLETTKFDYQIDPQRIAIGG
ncbi:MAG: FecR domain-containing protein [Woeseiaceae bacterium]